jgi:hypothetical protein
MLATAVLGLATLGGSLALPAKADASWLSEALHRRFDPGYYGSYDPGSYGSYYSGPASGSYGFDYYTPGYTYPPTYGYATTPGFSYYTPGYAVPYVAPYRTPYYGPRSYGGYRSYGGWHRGWNGGYRGGHSGGYGQHHHR